MFPPDRLHELIRLQTSAALCTVVETQGSTPRKAGAAMLVIADGTHIGTIEGTVGGGTIEHQVREAAVQVIETGIPVCKKFALTTDLGMCCGGQMTIFIENLRERPPLIIFGAGHVGEAVCRIGAQAGFDVSVADPRKDRLRTDIFPDAIHLHDRYEKEDFSDMGIGPDSFVLVVTHDHPTDQRLVEDLVGGPFRYLAMIGSKRKAAMTVERCRNKGISEAQIERLRSPAGLDIGAETPEEIAVSIVAEMIAHRRQEDATVASEQDPNPATMGQG
jgi:xanthine dehydrogenase accessory factor